MDRLWMLWIVGGGAWGLGGLVNAYRGSALALLYVVVAALYVVGAWLLRGATR